MEVKKVEKQQQKAKWIFNAASSFEIQKYYQNKPNLMVFILHDEYSDIGARWIALYVLNNDVTWFDSFGVEHTPKEIKTFVGNKNIKTNTFKIQAYDSIMCEYFCIGFIDFMLACRKDFNWLSKIFFHQITLKKTMI